MSDKETNQSIETKFAVLETLFKAHAEHMNDRLAAIERSVTASTTAAAERGDHNSQRLRDLHDKIDAMTLHMVKTETKMQSDIDGLKEREAERNTQQRNTSLMIWGAIVTGIGGLVTQFISWLAAK